MSSHCLELGFSRRVGGTLAQPLESAGSLSVFLHGWVVSYVSLQFGVRIDMLSLEKDVQRGRLNVHVFVQSVLKFILRLRDQ